MKRVKFKNIIVLIALIFLLVVIGLIVFKIITKPKTNNTKKENKKTVEKVDNKKYSAPEIKLLGREEDTRVVNGVYEEYGAVATDEYDGDLTKQIKIDNKIDITKAGDYKVIYSVTNSKKKTSKVERTVHVIDVTEPDTDGIAVLMFHYFYDDTAGEDGPDSNYYEKSSFEQDLKYLKDNNFYFPNFKEIRKYVDGTLTLPQKSLVITMDDGHADNYTIAYPLAVQYQVPITMFIVTSWTNPKDELQTQMYNTGYVYFMSHTHEMHEGGCSGEQHGARILCIDHATGVQDLKTSAEILGNADALAYPTGDNNAHSRAIVEEAGFALAFTVEYGKVTVGADPLTLPRVRINQGYSLDYFASILQ